MWKINFIFTISDDIWWKVWSYFSSIFYCRLLNLICCELPITHINSETNPPLLLIRCFARIWDSFLAQALAFPLWQYATTLIRGRGLIFLCKVDHSKISRNFFRNWIGLNNLCEILQIILYLTCYIESFYIKAKNNIRMLLQFLVKNLKLLL